MVVGHVFGESGQGLEYLVCISIGSNEIRMLFAVEGSVMLIKNFATLQALITSCKVGL